MAQTTGGWGPERVGAWHVRLRTGPAGGVTACWSLTSPRPGFDIYLPLPEGKTGRGLSVLNPNTPLALG